MRPSTRQWCALVVAACSLAAGTAPAAVYFATGCRVGEVSDNRALVWTRLTAEPVRRNGGVVPRPLMSPPRVSSVAPAIAVSDWEGAVPGRDGELRIRYATSPDLSGSEATPWQPVNAATDFSAKVALSNLKPNTRYYYAAEGRGTGGERETRSAIGSFRTAPAADAWEDVWFAVTTCQMYYQRDEADGYRLYRSLANLSPTFLDYPDFIVRTGDNVYYDRDNPRANTVDLCRLHWQRMFSLPLLLDFLRQVPSYWQKDDHDSLFDDSFPGMQAPWIEPLSYEDGARVFREQAPVDEKLFRTFRWGRGVQIWLTESRDFRSPNEGPNRGSETLWGEEQKAWLKQSLLKSDAAFKILISPTAIVGPDNADQADSHANRAFGAEGAEFRAWVREQKLDNLYVIAGDRHWQYASMDPKTGVREFACGPASDGAVLKGPGFDATYHSFYRHGGGFITVSFRKGSKKTLVNPQRIVIEEGAPILTVRIHDVDGRTLHEHRAASYVAQ
jgi:alkaline phosphatase D